MPRLSFFERLSFLMAHSGPTTAAMAPRFDLHRREREIISAGRHQRPLSGQLEYDTWAELLLKSNRGSFGRPDADPKFGPWARKPRPRHAAADELRRLRPPQKEAELEAQPENSRARLIERYRQEMMEMVRNMPEKEAEEVAPYELSLRDLVESPPSTKPEPEAPAVAAAEDLEMSMKPRRASRGENRGATLLFFVKTVMPRVQAALHGRRKISGGGASAGKGAKVSPKPGNCECRERSCSSGSSNCSGGRNSGRKASCYLFLHRDRCRSPEF